MALQKWAAPAGSPLLATQTADGAIVGNTAAGANFAASGDVVVGAVLRLTAHGTITTTGTPHLNIVPALLGAWPSALVSGGLNVPLAAPTGVTGQLWLLELVATYDGTNVRFGGSVHGLTATDFLISDVVAPTFSFGNWQLNIGWDQIADSDAGDQIVMHGCFVEWIG